MCGTCVRLSAPIHISPILFNTCVVFCHGSGVVSETTEQLNCLSLRVAARRLPRCSHQRGVVTKLRRERIVIGCNMINLALYCMYRTCTQCLHSLVRVVIISSLKDIYMYSSSCTVRKVLADFAVSDWRRNCKALCDVMFRQIEENGRKFRHIELSNSVIS